MKIRTLLIVFLIIPLILTVAQVSGISGAKLCVPDAGALSAGSFEFEPSFSVFNSTNRFCDNGAIESLAGKSVSSSVLFRVTAGIADGLEIGTAFSSTIEQVSVGSKYIFSESENFSLGLIAGVSLPAGNKFIADTLRDADNYLTSSYGALGSIKLSGSSSLDMIFSFTKIHGENSFDKILSYGIGFGQWFSEKFQVVAELNEFSTYNGKLHSGKLSFMPGVTYKISEQLVFVLGTQFDLPDKNENKNYDCFSEYPIIL